MSIFSSSRQRDHATHRNYGRTSGSRSGTHHRPSPRSSDAETSNAGGLSEVLTAALWSLPVMAILGLVLLLIVTAVAYANPDPDALTAPLGLGALGLTAVLGGVVSARCGRSRPLMCGLLSGVLFTLLLLCLSLFFGDDAKAQLTLGFPSVALWGLHGGVILLSLLGAKLGSRPRKKAHKTRR